jgi:hypothetical protein
VTTERRMMSATEGVGPMLWEAAGRTGIAKLNPRTKTEQPGSLNSGRMMPLPPHSEQNECHFVNPWRPYI